MNTHSYTPDIPESIEYGPHILETTRIIVTKRDSSWEDKFFTLTNDKDLWDRKNKSKNREGSIEFPWGKVYWNTQERDSFLRLDGTQKEKHILVSAQRELEEETGMYIHESRFMKIGYGTRDMQGGNYVKNGLNCSKYRTNEFLIYLHPDEYRNDFLEHSDLTLSQIENDDQHKEARWDAISFTELTEYLWWNSQIKKAGINSIVEEVREKVADDVVNTISHFNNVSPTGDIFSFIDIWGMKYDVSFEDFKKVYKQHFWSELTNEEAIWPIKNLLANEVIHSLDSLFDKLSMDTNKLRLEKMRKRFTKITSAKAFYDIFRRYANTPLWRQAFKKFVGYLHATNLPFFPYIEEYKEKFNQQISWITEEKDGKRIIKNFSWDTVYIDLYSNVKIVDRMASKFVTKAEIKPNEIKDVYRLRAIVKNTEDAESVKTYFLRKFGSTRSKKPGSWKLRLDEDRGTNTLRDTGRQEIKIIGEYPIDECEQWIPIEIQIMTQEQYQKNESWAKFHNIYSTIQELAEIWRGNIGIPKENMDILIDLLSYDEEAQQSYHDAHEKKKNELQVRLKKDIMHRISKYFFLNQSNEYISFQSVYRYRNISHITYNQDQNFRDLWIFLNTQLPINLYTSEWKEIFEADATSKSLEDIILHKVGIHIFELTELLQSYKFGFPQHKIDALETVMVHGVAKIVKNVWWFEKDVLREIFARQRDISESIGPKACHQLSGIYDFRELQR